MPTLSRRSCVKQVLWWSNCASWKKECGEFSLEHGQHSRRRRWSNSSQGPGSSARSRWGWHHKNIRPFPLTEESTVCPVVKYLEPFRMKIIQCRRAIAVRSGVQWMWKERDRDSHFQNHSRIMCEMLGPTNLHRAERVSDPTRCMQAKHKTECWRSSV